MPSEREVANSSQTLLGSSVRQKIAETVGSVWWTSSCLGLLPDLCCQTSFWLTVNVRYQDAAQDSQDTDIESSGRIGTVRALGEREGHTHCCTSNDQAHLQASKLAHTSQAPHYAVATGLSRQLQQKLSDLQKLSSQMESIWRMQVVKESAAKRDIWKR